MTQTFNQRDASTPIRPAMLGRGPLALGRIEKPHDARYALTRLAAYLAPFRLRLAFVFVNVIIYTLLGLLGPYLLGIAIDQYIVPKRISALPQIALLMLVTYVLNNLFQVIAGRSMATISQHALKQLRQELFSHLQSLPMRFFDRNPTGQTHESLNQ